MFRNTDEDVAGETFLGAKIVRADLPEGIVCVMRGADDRVAVLRTDGKVVVVDAGLLVVRPE